MAFDWAKVEGYKDELTPEEKLALLENYVPEEKEDKPVDLKGYIPKVQFDKLSSELASAKKQLKSKMTEDEQREADRLAEQEAMKAELEALKRDKSLNAYRAEYLAQGYDATLAEEAATSLVDGDIDAVFAVMRKQNALAEKAMRAKILKETPVPPAGENPTDEDAKKREEAKLRKYFGLPVS